jgi:CheY-like chemotaxis protein
MPRPVNALIVDDEPHVLVLLKVILKQLGIDTVWEALDGPAALELAAARNPEVVLLDLNLPTIDGLHVLEKLKADFPKMPVIIVSAQSTLRTFMRARELGAEGYILKYAPKPDVQRMLAEALDRIGAASGGDAPKGDAAESAKPT